MDIEAVTRLCGNLDQVDLLMRRVMLDMDGLVTQGQIDGYLHRQTRESKEHLIKLADQMHGMRRRYEQERITEIK